MRAVVGRQPVWKREGEEVAETAMLDMDMDGHEYRERDRKPAGHDCPDGADPMGLKVSGHEGMNPDGADPMGLNKSLDIEGAEEK